MMSRLAVRDLTVHFKANGKVARAVDGVSFSVEPRRTLGLVGESGCGKTVCALSIPRLLPRNKLHRFSGTIELEGKNLTDLPENQMRRYRGRQIGMIFQEPLTSLNPVLTVGDQIGEVLRLHRQRTRRQARREGTLLLENVGIPKSDDLWGAYPGQLSGGMRQRVMIAMAMAVRPKLLIADEPTTALDVTVQAQVLTLIDTMKRQVGAGVLLVTHDLGVVAEVCDDVCVMYAGCVVEQADVATLFDNPLHPYTRGLLSAITTLDQGRVKTAIPGQIGPATDYPSGCRFHPRCAQAMEVCARQIPQIIEIGSSRVACHLYPRAA